MSQNKMNTCTDRSILRKYEINQSKYIVFFSFLKNFFVQVANPDHELCGYLKPSITALETRTGKRNT